MGLGLFLFLLGIGFLITKRDQLVSFVVGGIGLAFLVLFGAINFYATNHDLIITQRVPIVMIGVINVPANYGVALEPAGNDPPLPYVQRETNRGHNENFNHRFIVVRRPIFSCATLFLSPKGANSYGFDLQVGDEVADGRTEILMRPQIKEGSTPVLKAEWQRDGNPTGKTQTITALPLNPATQDSVPGCVETASSGKTEQQRGALWRAIGSAFAAEPPQASLQAFVARLDSNDTITRRQARRDLSALGDDALPIIEQLLNQSSYRLQLGALQALAELPDASKSKIPEAIWAKRPELASDQDATMREVAKYAFNINFYPKASWCYQERDDAKPIDKRYLVLCQWSQTDCQTVRGDNPRTVQSACAVTDLRGKGKLQPGGVNGSWYLFAATEFGDPFPPLPK
jgi:hypothetical protein